MSSSFPTMPIGYQQLANVPTPYVPNFDEEQRYWQPRLSKVNNDINRIRSVPLEELTGDEAEAESFARADLDNFINDMDGNPAHRSDFFRAKILHLLIILARSKQLRSELLVIANHIYEQVVAGYGNQANDEISELGQNLASLRHGLQNVEENEEDAGFRIAPHTNDDENDNIVGGYSQYGNHLDINGEHVSRAAMDMDSMGVP